MSDTGKGEDNVLRNITQNIIMTFPKKRKVLKETWVSFTGFPLLGFLYWVSFTGFPLFTKLKEKFKKRS